MRDVEARHLAQRVHASVGAAGTDDGDGPTLDVAQRRLQLALDRSAVVLPLPADIRGAVVGEGQLERAHDRGTVHAGRVSDGVTRRLAATPA